MNVDTLSKNYVALEMTKKLKKIKTLLDFCKIHSYEPMRFLCNTCKEEICSNCLISHSGHSINP